MLESLAYASDRYTFTGAAGQLVALSLNSAAFDPYLYLIGPGGAVLAEDDDGTGIKFRSSLSSVVANIGGVNSQVFYAGGAEGFAGLDQINLLLPRSLAGRGDVEIRLSVDGKAANAATIRVK